ncbi:beta-1,4-N-acetylgalactosaminyltransferase bre-4 [Rhipicephalus sanguineus]|uniref:beta-1,4-N-acetylgalactosaminyltransferase bre-4 n=1 Tax=Rhipicephalus sanguineus TaxID=34632 RepID=UPI0020C1D214|nr:beta-1,4-N-acetylgalactosaminyltransferase bre-4 [Rhipicephalus sanguineus]
MVLVVVVVLLFTEHKVADPKIGNAEPFGYTDSTRQNLSVSTRDRHQRRAPLQVTPRPNFCSVNWKGGSDLLPVKKEGPPLSVLEKAMPHVMPGGRWFPTGCTARHRAAIVVPYRDRLSNLQAFLQHMHPFLQSQQLDYGIYVVEQVWTPPLYPPETLHISGPSLVYRRGNRRHSSSHPSLNTFMNSSFMHSFAQNDTEGFKRAKLFNAGYEIAKAMHNHSCFIFHDVDLLPENRRNMYACNEGGPFHLPTCIDRWNYTVIYPGAFGGVCAMHTEHMEKLNGFSNLFSKWGGEDDDMARRIWLLRRSFFRSFKDGLNSLKYSVLDIVFKKLYTHITVDISDSGLRKERYRTGN